MMIKPDLILNPYLTLRFLASENRKDYFWSSAPTKNVGVQILEFEREAHPNLYDLFFELNRTSLSFLDIEEDLSNADKNLLSDKGVLISPDKISQPPLFACFLDEITTDHSISPPPELIVSNSFYYDEALDYEAIIGRRRYGFEPHLPVAWVTNPQTEITFGYWLRHEFAEIVKNFKPGEKPAVLLTAQQNAVLQQAGILVLPESDNQTKLDQEQQNNLAEQFQKEKYISLRKILPSAQLAAINRYFGQLRAEGFMLFNDTQVSLRHAIHNDALSIYLHEQLLPLVSRTVGEKVKPSYAYSATYIEDAVLKPHTDRPQCEFTMSMQIGYQPEQSPDAVSPWALCLDDLHENKIETFLANGDALIYKGCELVHYRGALFKNHQSTSIFFHYVPENFEGSLD